VFNPLLIKEIRTRMRERTIFIVENVYLAVLLAVILIFVKYFMEIEDQGWVAGKMLFQVIIYLQVVLLSVITPAIVASSITLEREQKTYDMLLTTPLTIWQIVSNKMIAAVSYFLVLLFLSIPMVSVAFILGGVSSKQMFFSFVVTLDTLLLVGMLGMYCSTIFNRTISSVPISMVIILMLLILLAIAGQVFPAVAMLSPFSSISRVLGEWNINFYMSQIPFWVPHIILAVLLLAWAFFSSMERIKDVRKRNMIPARISLWLVLITLFLFSAGSMNFFVEDLKIIHKDIKMLVLLCFILCVLPAFIFGGAPLSTRDFEELRRKRSLLNAIVHRVFGGHLFSAPVFIALVSITAGLVIVFSLRQFEVLEDHIATGIMIGVMLFSFALMVCLFARILRGSSRIKSRTLPQIAGFFITVFMAVVPLVISSNVHEKEKNLETPADMVLFISPFFSVEAALDPEGTGEDHPYCEKLSGPLPMALVPSIIYLALAAIFALIGTGQEKRMKGYSRVELFYLRESDLAD